MITKDVTAIGENTKDEPLSGVILDEEGNVVEERQYATWADLCQPPAVKEVRLRNGLWVSYRPWIPVDKMAEIQRKSTPTRGRKGRGQFDPTTFMTLVLEEVLIRPRIKTEKDMRSARKADSSVVMGIINDVVDTETFEALKEDLGEV